MGKLLWYNELLSGIETENTSSAKYNLSLSANGMVYVTVHNIPGISHFIEKFQENEAGHNQFPIPRHNIASIIFSCNFFYDAHTQVKCDKM